MITDVELQPTTISSNNKDVLNSSVDNNKTSPTHVDEKDTTEEDSGTTTPDDLDALSMKKSLNNIEVSMFSPSSSSSGKSTLGEVRVLLPPSPGSMAGADMIPIPPNSTAATPFVTTSTSTTTTSTTLITTTTTTTTTTTLPNPLKATINDDSLTDTMSKNKLNQSQRIKLKKGSEKRLSHRPKSIRFEHKKNVLGEIIYKGHPSWALMLNIQTGIRNAVGKSMRSGAGSMPQQFHTLRTPKDFRNMSEFYQSPKELRFDSAGSHLTEAHSTGAFKFKDYCPNAFRYLRYQFGIDQADFLVSLCNTLKNGENALRELPTPGKSGSLFFFSHDMKYILKTIPKDEAKLLRELLPAYTDHLTSNPNTLLPKFFGLFRVKPHGGRQVRFVVMGNNFPTRKKIHERYDLKGSIVGREASENEKKSDSVTFKDIDFRNRNKKICIGPQKSAIFLDQIKKDCELLQSLNIMDYSLLIGIHFASRDPPSPSLMRHTLDDSQDDSPVLSRSMKSFEEPNEVYTSAFQQDEGGIKGVDEDGQANDEHYFMGIIDILMLYSLRKKLEHTYKTLKFGSGSKHEISSVSPAEYSKRFQDFLSTIIV
ncbi:hypothetical protein SAMD00019534_071470 [Acytostelium subglobosum LB1]|uniref:hypothetical protein n=1 Tax=Acytostelium subglobosum LB1 TaxID=1410327 RepID=UPI000644EFD8|nr:hypothetical protein SAMD00019534_071470 [Acytostelium subglobosum LB1]GAM23972.1 hypothetical protein SAMD00019534_071470 [Acytostelium subglobosum LB1]|eukprot:XP_012753008.1 hypothetical protein SAMD00019534_071470 [Acytostelium subglobosum LB1]